MANIWGKVQTVSDFIFLGSKITADDDRSHEIKRFLLLGRKAMTNFWHLTISLANYTSTKDPLVKVMVFPVVMYGCDSWTIKKTVKELTFSNCIAGRLLRVPWTARRSNESILKEINSEYSWEGLMLKMKLQYFGHLMGRADSWEKTLMLGKIEGKRRRRQQRIDG